MGEVLRRNVTVRVLLGAVFAALLVGGAAAYLVTSLPSWRQPEFRVTSVELAGTCEGPRGYPTSCPMKATLRNEGGTGTALLVVRWNAYDGMRDLAWTTSCTAVVPRTNHGDMTEASCEVVAGTGQWLTGLPTVAVRN